MLYSFDTTQIAKYKLPDAPELTNEYLMAQIKKEDEKALEELYHRHSGMLRSVIARIMNNESDIDDLVQEVFVELWNRAESYSEEKGKALGWMITLARRRAIDKLRKRQAYCRAEERLRLEPTAALHQSVDEEANAGELTGIFKKLFAQLPEAQRQALHLAYYCGLSQREIAARTGIPLGTVKTRLELALRKVRSAVMALGDCQEWTPVHVRV
jgi:RNA polymerase sigma-70 factor (ECF subfamily)